MSVVVLDTGPLAMLVHSRELPESVECKRWMAALWANGHTVMLPELADYEVRRELVRIGQRKSLLRLDSMPLQAGVEYVPLTTPIMRQAADLWAQTRLRGRPTADPKALDADVIIAASALDYQRRVALGDLVVASTNAVHLGLFVRTARWQEIDPANPVQ